MPTGTTSYFSGSRAAITLPAEMHEIECSLERPPKTTATRGLRAPCEAPSCEFSEGLLTRQTLPAPPGRARAHARGVNTLTACVPPPAPSTPVVLLTSRTSR